MKATAPTTIAEELDQAPLDIATMRESAQLVLGPDAAPYTLPPAADETAVLISTLRGHLELLTPEVQRTAEEHKDTIPAICALVAVGEARMKLGRAPRPGLYATVAYARRLARSVNTLCGYYESLGSASS